MNEIETFEELYRKVLASQKVMEAKAKAFDYDDLSNKNFDNDNGLCPVLNKAREYVKNWEVMRDNNCGLLLLMWMMRLFLFL